MTDQTVDQTQAAADAAQTAAPEASAQPDLNISDLVALRNIVDVASQRGAFKAAELEAVGKTYNKLNSFIEAATAKKE
jgi:hypothetical protein